MLHPDSELTKEKFEIDAKQPAIETEKGKRTSLETTCDDSTSERFEDLLKTSCRLYFGRGKWEDDLNAWKAEIYKIVNEYQETINSLTKSVELLGQFEPIWRSEIISAWVNPMKEKELRGHIYFTGIAIFLSAASLIALIWARIRNSKPMRALRIKIWRSRTIRRARNRSLRFVKRTFNQSTRENSRPSPNRPILLILIFSVALGLRCVYLNGYILSTSFWAWLAGVMLTAIMASFGAPFWFDLLNKLVNRRAAGPKPAGSETISE